MAAVVASAAQQAQLDELLPTDDDLLYEEELLRNPYSLKMWLRYLAARADAPPRRRCVLYERALKALPGSYKLWAAYLSERRLAVRGARPDAPTRAALANTYERALVTMHKMPRVWLDYLELLTEGPGLTSTRHAFDRALRALPVTQHDRVWALYLKFVAQPEVPRATAAAVYRRYLQLEPHHVEEFIAYCRANEMWGEVASRLAGALNDDTFRSLEGKTKHALWLELCDTVTRHPKAVAGSGVDVEGVLRGGIRRFTEEVGRLWTALADYHIRRGAFERARDVYEEGLSSVATVRDFGLVFDALTHFEESLLAARMAQLGDDDGAGGEGAGAMDADGAADPSAGDDFVLKDDGDDVDMRLARLEALAARRPELLSAVMLRQNPHNVAEWHKRAKLFEGDPTKQILTYTEAVKTVDTGKALGKPHSLWVSFAKFYEGHGDVANARVIFAKAAQVPYKYVDDLAVVYCEWAEMELRHRNFKRALDLARAATAKPPRARALTQDEERALPVQERLYRSSRLWAFYVDLEESLGTLESAKAAYERALELRVATPQMVLNCALMLAEAKHWEDAFRVYERGVAAFKYPHVGDIWLAYLKDFVARYGGSKLERARDLFETAISAAPPDACKPLYLEYAALEERHGLARRAMEVYARAVAAVPKDERLSVVDAYAARAADFFGVAKVREVYEAAIEAGPPAELPHAAVRELCVRYANLERKLGEIDRARAVFAHGAALADPRAPGGGGADYWAAWSAFEVKHGNEDTFKEMLRIKRSVAASHAQMRVGDPAAAAAAADAADAAAAAASGGKRPRDGIGIGTGGIGAADPMAALEAAAAAPATGTRLSGFVSAGIIQQGNNDQQQQAGGLAGQQQQGGGGGGANPEEIDVGGDDDGEDGAGGAGGGGDDDDDGGLAEKAVPASVFGGLAAAAAAGDGGDGSGALERFKKRRVG